MKKYYQAKVAYMKEDEQGRLRNVTETYLAAALSFTESESKVYKEIGDRVMCEFKVKDISESRIIDVFEYPDAETFWQCKLQHLVIDADSGREKRITTLALVTAANIKDAYANIVESLKNMLVSFQVVEIKRSQVLEVFYHRAEEKKEDNQ